MNIVKTEPQFVIEAKTSGYNKNKRIRYYFVESVHTLCLDKAEIILAQIQACEILLKYTKDDVDISAIKKEILELKYTLIWYNIDNIGNCLERIVKSKYLELMHFASIYRIK